MKRCFLFLLLVFCLGSLGFGNTEGKTKINILLKEQSDPIALGMDASLFGSKQERCTFVVESLKRHAEISQAHLMELLEELKANGLVSDIDSYWLVNGISCMANPSVIPQLEQRPEVMAVYRVEEAQWIHENEATPVPQSQVREITQNLLQVHAPEVWAQGYTGAGVLVALIDTGVRLDHADLAGRLWDGGPEYPHHGYDFYYHDNDPSDDRGHGTHVAGTICGTGAAGLQTGIAPGATIMALKAFNDEGVGDETHWVAAMQFALEHGADVMNMSLGRPQPSPSQKLMMRQACDNTLAAGVVVAACAGNIRQMQFMVPVPYNIYTPGDCPPPHLHEDQLANPGGTSCVICVGAVDYDNQIAQFSSEGPSQWTDVDAYNDYPFTSGSSTEIGLIRPDICAPGVQIKSLDYNTTDGYTLMDGTSMATPLVTGTIALMLSKNPRLTPEQIDEILERTAMPLSAHKSNDFGAGLLDALAAVNTVNFEATSETTMQQVQVYPNPSTGNFTIQCEGMQHIEVFTMDGRLVKSVKTESPVHQLNGLTNGTYLVKITTNDGVIVIKAVIQ